MQNHVNKPLVSVIMPAYNAAGFIDKAIQSVLVQDVSLELLIIDDHSSDNLPSVLSTYQNDIRVHYYRNDKNMGVAFSRNKGVQLSKGDYIAFLDADDWWMEHKLSRQLRLLIEKDSVLCCTARELITHAGKGTGKVIPVSEEITYKMLLKHNSINCSSVLLPKYVAEQFPMEHEDAHEDYITWLKILMEYGSACAINEPLIKYRLSENSKSGSKLKSAAMTFKTYQYMGFSIPRCCLCFISYAIHGLLKYG